MTPEELDEALRRGAWVAPPKPASPVQPVGGALGDMIGDCDQALAGKHRLIDDQNQLHCWNCGDPTDWHVSLHCTPCRVRSVREAPERRRLEYQRQEAERRRELERSSPVQKVANRSFRDE